MKPNTENLIEHTQETINALREELKEGKYLVAIYAPVTHVPNFFIVGREVGLLGHKVVFFVPFRSNISDEDRFLAGGGEIIEINKKDISALKNIDVFITNEIDLQFHPKGAKTVGIFHSLPENTPEYFKFSLHFIGNDFITEYTDYFVVARIDKKRFKEKHIKKFVTNTFPKEMISERTKNFHVIPGGYPKIDYLSERISGVDTEPKSILYAPTNVALQSPVSRVQQDGGLIISSLLEYFPEYEVIFRPYPTPKNYDAVSDILESFGDHERFFLDRAQTPTVSQLRSILVISDISSISLSFAMASLRPFISCELSNRLANAGSCGSEHDLGYTVYNAEQLVNAVNDIISRKKYWVRKLAAETKRYVYNPGCSGAYIAKQIDLIARSGSRDDWLAIPRSTPSWSLDSVEDYIQHINQLKSNGRIKTASSILEFAQSFFTDDTELAALSSLLDKPKKKAIRPISEVKPEGDTRQALDSINKIANGNFEHWTRGTKFAATGFTADDWYSTIGNNGSVGVIKRKNFTDTKLKISGDSPYFLRLNQLTAGTFNYLLQNLGDVRTCADHRVTFSFFAKSDKIRKFAKILLVQRFGEGGSANVSTQVTTDFPITSTWNKYSFEVTLPDVDEKSIKEGNQLDLIFYTNYASADNFGTYDLANIRLTCPA